MQVNIQPTYEKMSKVAAQLVADVLNTKPNAVLGMATGSTPLGLYQELVRLHKEQRLDFSRVTTFASTLIPGFRGVSSGSATRMR